MDGLLSHIHLTARPDPFLVAWARWYEARSLWCFEMYHSRNGNFDGPTCKAAERRWFAALDALQDVSPQGQMGIAAAAHVLWAETQDSWNPGCLPPKLSSEERLSRHLTLSIWQAASGRDGLPPDFRHLSKKGG
jgi:hypothetical protein